MENKQEQNKEDENKEKEEKKFKNEGIKNKEEIIENKKSDNKEEKIGLNSEKTLTNIFENSNTTNLDNLEIKNFIYNNWNKIESKIEEIKKNIYKF